MITRPYRDTPTESLEQLSSDLDFRISELQKAQRQVNQEIKGREKGAFLGDEIEYEGIVGVVSRIDSYFLEFYPYKKGSKELSKNHKVIYNSMEFKVLRSVDENSNS